MKKKLLRLSVLILIMTVVLTISGITAFAAEAQYVYDPAYLLNDEEYAELNNLAAGISEKYGCAVHFVTSDDPALNPDNIQLYSEDLYLDSPALGYGESKDGVMLVLGTYNRCYWLLAYGPYGNYSFTDYGKDWMSENFTGYFADDNWYEGLKSYIMDCEYMLSCAEAGTPVDIIEDIGAEGYGMAGIAGIIAAFITCGIFKRKMRTVYSATEASHYMDAANVQILHRSDIFTYQDVQRRRRSSDDDDSSGGTTVNSRGFSGKGGSF